MPDDTTVQKVVQLPTPKEQISEEERNRRIVMEAARLANLSPGEWKLWYKGSAERLGIEPDKLCELITTLIIEQEKKAREKRVEEKLQEERAERQRKTEAQRFREQVRREDAAARKSKQKSKAFADIIKLPIDEQDGKIKELAKQLDEDAATLAAEFAEYREAETAAETKSSISDWDIEPWSEPITTTVVLEELVARINTHIVAKPHEVLSIALWILMAWVHEVAAHYSVYLVASSPTEDCGKTTLIVEVVGGLGPKHCAYSSDPTPASVFRLADREKPMMTFDNVDTLFQRKPEITELFLNGWTRGIPVWRSERTAGNWVTVEFDPFCPKACTLIGSNIPRPLLTRCLLIELWKAKPGEEPVEVNPHDQELLEQFQILRSKIARWANDHGPALKSAKPIFPPGFTTRPKANAKLLLAIAELAGADWAELARSALDRLLREKREPSWLERLLQELWTVFIEQNRKAIPSDELVTRLTADPTSEWLNYHGGKRVNQWDLGALLKKLHIRSRLVGRRRVGGYHRQDFLDNQVFQRWLGQEPLNVSPRARKGRG